MTPFGVILARSGGKKTIKTIGLSAFWPSPFGVFLTSFGLLLGPSWRSLGSLSLAPLGSPQAPQGVLLRASRWPMGCPWDPRNLSWMPLGPILGTVFVSSSPNGASMTCFGAPRDQFCLIWRPAFRHSRAPGGPKGPTCTLK